jgi:hypothetical protein
MSPGTDAVKLGNAEIALVINVLLEELQNLIGYEYET